MTHVTSLVLVPRSHTSFQELFLVSRGGREPARTCFGLRASPTRPLRQDSSQRPQGGAWPSPHTSLTEMET